MAAVLRHRYRRDQPRGRTAAADRRRRDAAVPGAAPAPWNSTDFFNDPDRKNAYSHQWHVELQRQITGNLMVGRGLRGQLQRPHGVRRAAPQALSSRRRGRDRTPAHGGGGGTRMRPWPHINGTFTYSDDIGMSQVQRAPGQGAAPVLRTVCRSIFSYTFSQTIDTSSGWFGAENGIGGAATVQNYHDIDSNHGAVQLRHPAHRHLGHGVGAALRPRQALAGQRWRCHGFSATGSSTGCCWRARASRSRCTVGGDPANVGFTGYAAANLVGDPEEGAGPLSIAGSTRRRSRSR